MKAADLRRLQRKSGTAPEAAKYRKGTEVLRVELGYKSKRKKPAARRRFFLEKRWTKKSHGKRKRRTGQKREEKSESEFNGEAHV